MGYSLRDFKQSGTSERLSTLAQLRDYDWLEEASAVGEFNC